MFKVIYICPNQNIANQNIRKLDVTGKISAGSVSDTRLSMQHLKITELENDSAVKDDYIQLIPFTPETSFHMTAGGGIVKERAMLMAVSLLFAIMVMYLLITLWNRMHLKLICTITAI